jgi:hypothetical protein
LDQEGRVAEHSKMLWSLRRLPHFAKMNGEMIKGYGSENE